METWSIEQYREFLKQQKPATIRRSSGGTAPDLGIYMRSSWERNYARWLNWRGLLWEYEPETFWFPIKRGTRSYTPDFRLIELHEWHEVKGFYDQKTRTRLARMKKYFQAERIVLIDAVWFRDIERRRICKVIPGWECKHTISRKNKEVSYAETKGIALQNRTVSRL